MTFLKELKLIEKSLLKPSPPKIWKPHIRGLKWHIGCFCITTILRNIWGQSQKSLKMAHFIRRNKVKLGLLHCEKRSTRFFEVGMHIPTVRMQMWDTFPMKSGLSKGTNFCILGYRYWYSTSAYDTNIP